MADIDGDAYEFVKNNDHRGLVRRIRDAANCFPINMSGTNCAGMTLLHVACYQGNLECSKILLDNRANAHLAAKKTKSTPLHLAALSGNIELVRLLLQYQARPDVQDAAGKTSLHFAAVGGNLEVIRLLLRSGASTSIEDDQGRTPYDYALEKDQLDAAELIGEVMQTDEQEDKRMKTEEVRLTFDKLDLPRPAARPKPAKPREPPKGDAADGRGDGRDGDARGVGLGGGALWVPMDGRLGGNDPILPFKPAPRQRRPKDDPAPSVPAPAADRRRPGDEPNGVAPPVDRADRAAPAAGKGGRGSVEGLREFLDAELSAVVGLEPVKGMLRSLCKKVAVDRLRSEHGFKSQQGLNMLFLGNPGTGKTSMARIVAKVALHALGEREGERERERGRERDSEWARAREREGGGGGCEGVARVRYPA